MRSQHLSSSHPDADSQSGQGAVVYRSAGCRCSPCVAKDPRPYMRQQAGLDGSGKLPRRVSNQVRAVLHEDVHTRAEYESEDGYYAQ